MSFDDRFMGNPLSYWRELELTMRKTTNAGDIIAANAILRAKVSYYEEQLDKATQFRKVADNQGTY